MNRSHIDDIIGLIDGVLGPDDNGPVPEFLPGYRVAHYHRVPAAPERLPRIPSRRGPVSVHALRYLTIRELFDRIADRSECPLANNTKLVRNEDGSIGVVLHQTQIMTIEIYYDVTEQFADITLNTGGWETVTTKQRLNALLSGVGYRITSINRQWYLTGPTTSIPFFDGMTITIPYN